MAVDANKQLERAKRYLEKNKFEDAIEAYQAVLSEVPNHPDALQAMGDIYTRLSHPDRAATYYSLLFDRLFEAREENKALALYTRALKNFQQPPERRARYAWLLQKANRAEEAIEQFALASELLLARGKDEPALDCLERVAQLDPENAARQFAVGELADRLGKTAVAARAFLRAGQLTESAGEAESAQELYARAHQLLPSERSPALLYARSLLRCGNPMEAAKLLEPFTAGELDAEFLATLGEALMQSGALDRAGEFLGRLPLEQPGAAARLFRLVECYLAANQDAQAIALLRKIQRQMVAARHESDFTVKLDSLVETHAQCIPLAEFWVSAYADLNRESKYFDALVRLFDLYLDAGNIPGAGDALEKLVDIDPYDSRNQQRVARLEGRAGAPFLERMHARLTQVATNTPLLEPTQQAAPSPGENEANRGQQTLEDLIVQAEIFIQYSLQAKAVERLQKIAELFPGEQERNERLYNLCQLANWWPDGKVGAFKPGAKAAEAGRGANAVRDAAAPSGDNMRDLSKISEIGQSLFRLASPRAILSAAINEMGSYLHLSRCVAVIGAPGKPPQMATEFCAQGMEPAPGATLVRLLAQFDRAAPDSMGGLPLEAAAAPALREMGLETALGVMLTDRETQTHAGMVIAGHAGAHAWRPNETYFLQAVGDQMLLGVSHTRLRNMVRTLGAADDKTGLLSRSSYEDCLLNETQRAKSQGTALALALLEVDRGAELLRQQGESHLERYIEQLARGLEPVVRQTDLTLKYTSWAIAFVLPDTSLAGAQALAEKLRTAGAQIHAPWDDLPVSLSVSVAEAVARPDYDSEDIVTELMNRAEFGLEEAHKRGGDTIVALGVLGK